MDLKWGLGTDTSKRPLGVVHIRGSHARALYLVIVTYACACALDPHGDASGDARPHVCGHARDRLHDLVLVILKFIEI
jgi:hypothetical protein